MYKLLVHVGLPKTATSSLQRNVLMPLHEQGRINFLGRYAHGPRLFDKVFDPFADVLDRIRARRLPPDELRRLRLAMEGRLEHDRLNVISNENISRVRVVAEDPPMDALVTLHNLAGLFRDDNVTLLVSLRNPADYVLAWYVEEYYWRFYQRREYASMDWFFKELLRRGPDDGSWIAFFYEAYLRAVARYFDRINVLLYEDLEHDRPTYFSTIAAGLSFDPEEIERLFLRVRQNRSIYTPSGKRSRELCVRHVVGQRFPRLYRWYADFRPVLRRIPLLFPLCQRLGDIETAVTVEYSYPDEETRQRLQERLGLRDDYLTRVHGVSEEKLARYGYLHPSRTVERVGRGT